jgi:hypothetical protein
MSDPQYMSALTRITARMLRETFLASGLVAAITLIPAAILRGRERRTHKLKRS